VTGTVSKAQRHDQAQRDEAPRDRAVGTVEAIVGEVLALVADPHLEKQRHGDDEARNEGAGAGQGAPASSAETQMLAAENTARSGAVLARGNRSFW
jgi:hypothetical protein